ncbi:MAG: NUDIX domain-containing protein [Rhodospirillaceae bacterium]|nr:NUDIX domain-containing protein [Rhodospirillaceae bacterium]MYI48474.1 NUDIX domain-containing protein [Rhodospirillaceae bacterium]
MPPRTRNFTLSRRLGHPRKRHEGRPVTPRDAATLILVRHGSDGPEILMGQRSNRAKFVPGSFVFPGGRLDGHDWEARPATPLAAPVAKMGLRGNSAKAQALAMAAIRETFEETGLLLAAAGDVGAADDETWREMRALGKAPDLARLTYLARAITSPYSPIRFHARFFTATYRPEDGGLGGSGELSDLQWIPIARADDFGLLDVTHFMLGEIRRRLAEPAADTVPLFAYRLDRPFVRYD